MDFKFLIVMDNTNLSIKEIKEICSNLENKVIDMYLNRYTQKVICSTLSIKRHFIDKLVRTYALGRFRDRKLSYCGKVLTDMPEFWYFLGLFASDGNLYYKSNSVDTIQFTLDDREALEDIKNILQCNNNIKDYKRGNKVRWYINISDVHLVKTVQDIFNSNCYRKTFNIKFPKIPNIHSLVMFLRGFFDGDGCFAKSHINGFFNFKIYCASASFINTLYSILCNIVSTGVHFYNGNTLEITAQEKVYKLCKFLYSYNPLIGIIRKRERAMQHINNYELKI